MKTLETERLILRGWAPGDLDDMYEYARNPNIGPNAGWEPHAGRDVTATVLQSFIEHDNVWAIEHKENGKVIGSIGIHSDKLREGINSRMIGYVLSEDYWGRGLMSEAARRAIQYAFEETGIDILSVYHYTFNQRSRRVIEKCGFRYEGTLRMASKIYDGTVLDNVCYSITRDEYNEMQRVLK